MKKTLYFTPLFMLLTWQTWAQRTLICAHAAIDSIRSVNNAGRAIKKLRFEQALANVISAENQKSRIGIANEDVIRIPVVVHIVHNQADGSIRNNNIPDEQVFSQIKVLNEDYRRKQGTLGFNTNPVGADIKIEFFLASKDPNGNPTSGITRHYTSTASFSLISDADRTRLSNLGYWDSNKYLNIWVTTFRSPYIGYAEFPYAETVDGLSEQANENIDGVFIDYRVFGKKSGTNTSGLYSMGRTTTHEIGHWLGLIHTWGDEYCGTDYVADTPPTSESNNSAFCTDKFSNCSGTLTRNMIENYMDYTPDSCMNIFTVGQKDRMRAVLDLSQRRKRVVNYARFELPPSTTLAVNLVPNPTTKENIQVQVLLPDFQDFTISLIDIKGRSLYTATFKDYPSTVISINATDLVPGSYFMRVISKEQQATRRLVIL
ncbi:M43 family zinc metalloprotease [Emticicia sp. 21SJ11W-3]|uniref:M43 family zinc metalloprotease n=1 Tax=Emticicia sp. 21SJ11W-3 TaxID=2916755 RepID=UPI00209C8E36|nr:M43 family zinc metalloprotease [Emticicia sp. 21SJ11W-3]UTA66182.1 T9SS type A sorting domain-containing protein [Emticicia sp. 21SJ11W-3]